MFEIGFTELIVIGVVALIVIGPERMPKVARTAGHLYGRLQRYVSSVKSDISREVEFEELRRSGQQFKESMTAVTAEVAQQTSVVDDFLRQETASVGASVAALAQADDVRPAAHTLKSPPSETTPQQSLPLDEPDQNRSPDQNHTPDQNRAPDHAA